MSPHKDQQELQFCCPLCATSHS